MVAGSSPISRRRGGAPRAPAVNLVTARPINDDTTRKAAAANATATVVPAATARGLKLLAVSMVLMLSAALPYALLYSLDGSNHHPPQPQKQQQQQHRPDPCRVAAAMSSKPLTFSSYGKGLGPAVWPAQIPHVSSIICDRLPVRKKTKTMTKDDAAGGTRLHSSSATLDNSRNEEQHKITDAAESREREERRQKEGKATAAAAVVRSILTFKSARSGSTFFTEVITTVLTKSGRPTTKYWEPSFCPNRRQFSDGPYRAASYQAEGVKRMLTKTCKSSKCQPAADCSGGKGGGGKHVISSGGGEVREPPVYIVALNPRFLNPNLNWTEALGTFDDDGGGRLASSSLRIFALRRTNLILMAYSKFHHGGCQVGDDEGGTSDADEEGGGEAAVGAGTGDGISPPDDGAEVGRRRRRRLAGNTDGGGGGGGLVGDKKKKRKRGGRGRKKRQTYQFTFERMLRCVHHYAIGDQELSTSIAFGAAEASKSGGGVDPFLILYEDVVTAGTIVQGGVLRHVGLGGGGGEGEGAGKTDGPAAGRSGGVGGGGGENTNDVFRDNANDVKKTHSEPFCDYGDVDCPELEGGLEAGAEGGGRQYPCLLKQLRRAGDGLTWSMPLLPDGTVSIEGDCYPLNPLGSGQSVRSVEELYQLPPRG